MTSAPSTLRLSIGMPVYNGAKSLAKVLEKIRHQVGADTEIIISDNGSTDETPQICQAHAQGDNRIKYFRQAQTLSPTDNFNFVLSHATAPFFMWAAHDDERSDNFYEVLLHCLESNPATILAFGSIVQNMDGEPFNLNLDFENQHLTQRQRLQWAANNPLHHLYGIWRTAALRKVKWLHTQWWHDTPLMMAASMVGNFAKAPEAIFYYQYNRHPFFAAVRTKPSLGAKMKVIGHRMYDLFDLVRVSVKMVYQVAGGRAAMWAGVYATQKISSQILTYMWGRLGWLKSSERPCSK